MNGSFFVLDTNTEEITSMKGKYISHYNETWVISKEPERSTTASGYGTADEWETLYDLETELWLQVPVKEMSALGANLTITGAYIVDQNVVGSFVDYVVQYQATTQNIYYRDRNVDGVFSTANYSVYNDQEYFNSIIGSYGAGESYITLFNNSVMLYENLRLVIQGTQAVCCSYTVTPSRIGTLLVPFGELADNAIPTMFTENQKQYVITKTPSGFMQIIRLGTDIPNRIVRMAQYVHRINTVDVINILVEREGRVTTEPGSLDWNNKFEIQNRIETADEQEKTAYRINSAYNPFWETTRNRSASLIVSDTSLTLYGTLNNKETENGYSLNFINANLSGGGIDVCFSTPPTAIYKYSIINGIQRFNSAFEGFSFPSGVIVPFPVGTIWSIQNEVVAIGQMGKELMAAGLTDSNRTLDLYLYSNQVYFGKASFVLFGVQYVFDGDYIYQDSERIAMAFGYMFVGCDNNSAYFYNPWDKSVYQFTGARNLLKLLSLSNRSPVKIGRYDGFSGEMVLLTEDEILKNRNGSVMNFPYVPDMDIIPTKHGPYVELEDGVRILLSPLKGDVDIYEVITGFIGVDGSTVCDYERVDVRLYSPDKTALSFVVELQTINQDTKQSEQKQITLKGNDWSVDGYKTIKLIPQHKKGTGLSLRMYSEEAIYIAGIEFTYNEASRTANSQRSGF